MNLGAAGRKPASGFVRFAIAVISLLLLAACASTAVDTTDAATTARHDAFKSGNVILPMGTIEAADWTINRQAAYNLLAAGRWRELADLVQRKGINNDLNWYYLGRAAEGLGEAELARVYYQRSIERTKSDKYSHRCQGKVMSMCDGFDFPDVAQTRLGALKAAAPAEPGMGGPVESEAAGNALLRGCGAVSFLLIGGSSTHASVIASDPINDLALLKLRDHPKSASVFQDPDKLRPGDDIIVFGYPLVGQLASAGNLTRGSVTALSGLRDDARYFQMSAPIQLGNSGGPVLNQAGRVTGVVTYKLNAARELKTTGDISQNVNFALKNSVLRSFLDSNNVSYARANATSAQSAADVGSEAAKFTGIVGCYKN